MPNESEKAYLAGQIDADGTICLIRSTSGIAAKGFHADIFAARSKELNGRLSKHFKSIPETS